MHANTTIKPQTVALAYLHVWEGVLEQPDGALAEAVGVEGLLG
jgi:hypothetical protein